MGWWQLIDIAREAADPGFRGDEIERGTCARDGEPFRAGPNGIDYCPFCGEKQDDQQVGPGRF